MSPPPAKKLGAVVRELRERQGLTQAQLAERAQIALSYITVGLGRLARSLGVPAQRLTEVGG